jgi:GNAT superfamily N-acetyltransferase
MTLRIATIADISAMHAVRLSVRENMLSDPARITYEDTREMIETRGRGWVFEADGRIAGFAVADHSRRNIWALFVAPGFEGRGIGRALHDVMVNWLFETGPAPVWLTTEPGSRAERFYRAAGWRCTGAVESGEMRFERTEWHTGTDFQVRGTP